MLFEPLFKTAHSVGECVLLGLRATQDIDEVEQLNTQFNVAIFLGKIMRLCTSSQLSDNTIESLKQI